MNWETTIMPVIISTAVCAAAVAAIANVIVAIMNNTRLKIIENDKYSAELTHYRLEKLYIILEEIISIPKPISEIIIYTTEQVTSDYTYYKLVNEKYLIVKPFLENDFYEKLDLINTKINELKRKAFDERFLFQDKGWETDTYKDLFFTFRYFENQIINVIQDQISRLLRH